MSADYNETISPEVYLFYWNRRSLWAIKHLEVTPYSMQHCIVYLSHLGWVSI